MNEVKETFEKGIVEAIYMGFSKEELIALTKDLLDEMEGANANDKN